MNLRTSYRHYFAGMFLFFLVAGGCASSNLNKRPEWAKMTSLTGEHPLSSKYPKGRFLSVIVSGTGRTLSGAKDDAREKAYNAFSEMVNLKVNSSFKSETNFMSDGMNAVMEDNIDSLVSTESKSTLAGIEEVLSWDGREKREKYYFACYVLDKVKSGNNIYALAKEKHSELKELEARFKSGEGLDEDSAERLSLNVLKLAMEFRILSHEALFFGKKMDLADDFSSLEIDSLNRVYSAGDRKEALGEERGLEEALKLYGEAYKYRPDEIFKARIINVKKHLPCTDCGFEGSCVQCKGEKGSWKTCSVCKGGLKVNVKCPVCNGDGRKTCEKCNGQKKLTRRCLKCTAGKIKCPDCEGNGSIDVECPKTRRCLRCLGTGKIKETTSATTVPCPVCGRGTPNADCTVCNGRGVIEQPGTVQSVGCERCGGDGKTTCSLCNGTGSRNIKCEKCKATGEIKCPECKGTKNISVICTGCQGIGRRGTCQNCKGVKKIVQDCTSCKDGKEWIDCSHCSGKGVCPVCGGIGHRK